MTLWAKSVRIFNSIREHGKSSIRRLAERTGLSKSSVHRQLQAASHRDRYPESGLWEIPEGRDWLLRLVVATLFIFGLGSIWILGSYVSKISSKVPNNAFPRRLTLCTNSKKPKYRVVYPRPADNVSGPLLIRLRGLNQPVIHTLNGWSRSS